MRIFFIIIAFIASLVSFAVSAQCYEQLAFNALCDSLINCKKQEVKQEYFYSGYSTGEISSLQIIAECVGDMNLFSGDKTLNDSLLVDNFLKKNKKQDLKSFPKNQLKELAYHFYVLGDSSGLQLKDDCLTKINCQKVPIVNNSKLNVKTGGYKSKSKNHFYISICNAITYNGSTYVLLRITNNYHGVEEWVVFEYGVSTKIFRKKVYICQS